MCRTANGRPYKFYRRQFGKLQFVWHGKIIVWR